MLQANPDDPQIDGANKMELNWAEGTPDMTITIPGYVADMFDENSQLLMAFIAGWIHFDSQRANPPETQESLYYTTRALAVYYDSFRVKMKKDKDVEKLIKRIDRGELMEWIQEETAVNQS